MRVTSWSNGTGLLAFGGLSSSLANEDDVLSEDGLTNELWYYHFQHHESGSVADLATLGDWEGSWVQLGGGPAHASFTDREQAADAKTWPRARYGGSAWMVPTGAAQTYTIGLLFSGGFSDVDQSASMDQGLLLQPNDLWLYTDDAFRYIGGAVTHTLLADVQALADTFKQGYVTESSGKQWPLGRYDAQTFVLNGTVHLFSGWMEPTSMSAGNVRSERYLLNDHWQGALTESGQWQWDTPDTNSLCVQARYDGSETELIPSEDEEEEAKNAIQAPGPRSSAAVWTPATENHWHEKEEPTAVVYMFGGYGLQESLQRNNPSHCVYDNVNDLNSHPDELCDLWRYDGKVHGSVWIEGPARGWAGQTGWTMIGACANNLHNAKFPALGAGLSPHDSGVDIMSKSMMSSIPYPIQNAYRATAWGDSENLWLFGGTSMKDNSPKDPPGQFDAAKNECSSDVWRYTIRENTWNRYQGEDVGALVWPGGRCDALAWSGPGPVVSADEKSYRLGRSDDYSSGAWILGGYQTTLDGWTRIRNRMQLPAMDDVAPANSTYRFYP